MPYTLRNTGLFDENNELYANYNHTSVINHAILEFTDENMLDTNLKKVLFKKAEGNIKQCLYAINNFCFKTLIVLVEKDASFKEIEQLEGLISEVIFKIISSPPDLDLEDEKCDVRETRKHSDIIRVCKFAQWLIYGEWKDQPELAGKTDLKFFKCDVHIDNLPDLIKFLKLNSYLFKVNINILGTSKLSEICTHIESLKVEVFKYTYTSKDYENSVVKIKSNC